MRDPDSKARAGAGGDGGQYPCGAPSADLIHPGVLRYLREIGLAK